MILSLLYWILYILHSKVQVNYSPSGQVCLKVNKIGLVGGKNHLNVKVKTDIEVNKNSC